ncbi:hypothetical protein AB6A40_004052 [Gnathostoma spinigerum]|uniref:Uncharacterized protein n=1 Tax=Gnathostoma spinigerum TaxID=75299 RepID=A0ABD6EBI3_9BILA
MFILSDIYVLQIFTIAHLVIYSRKASTDEDPSLSQRKRSLPYTLIYEPRWVQLALILVEIFHNFDGNTGRLSSRRLLRMAILLVMTILGALIGVLLIVLGKSRKPHDITESY